MVKEDKNAELVWATPDTKRGRKPLGQKAMTDTERKARSRELSRESGKREFLVTVSGLHLDYVEALAKSQETSTASALKLIVEATLDRYVGVMKRSERMIENGIDEALVSKFISDHLFPALPTLEERKK